MLEWWTLDSLSSLRDEFQQEKDFSNTLVGMLLFQSDSLIVPGKTVLDKMDSNNFSFLLFSVNVLTSAGMKYLNFC